MPKVSKRAAKSVAKTSVEEHNDDTIVMSAAQTSTVYFSEEFSSGRYLVYSNFNGQDWIHIREYVTMGEKSYPTKKGACFTPGRFKSLANRFDVIDEQLKQVSANASDVRPWPWPWSGLKAEKLWPWPWPWPCDLWPWPWPWPCDLWPWPWPWPYGFGLGLGLEQGQGQGQTSNFNLFKTQ